MAAIEFAYNVFPATAVSSLVLQAVHVIFLVGIFAAKVPCPFEARENPILKRRKKRTRKPIGPELPPDIDLPPFDAAAGDDGAAPPAASEAASPKSGKAKKDD